MDRTKLQQWILKQPYFHLDIKYDGMTAWELAGKIIEAGRETELNEMIKELKDKIPF